LRGGGRGVGEFQFADVFGGDPFGGRVAGAADVAADRGPFGARFFAGEAGGLRFGFGAPGSRFGAFAFGWGRRRFGRFGRRRRRAAGASTSAQHQCQRQRAQPDDDRHLPDPSPHPIPFTPLSPDPNSAIPNQGRDSVS